ncbi:4-diphosphocytidyl-2-C-methyl-D-erythritol kinase [Alphaproteobacteria bacterium]
MLVTTSHAKVNLFLYIVGKHRTSRRHLLQSLFLKLNLADVISVEECDSIVCNVVYKVGSTPIIHGQNTVIKALNLLLEYANCASMLSRKISKYGAKIHITKNIPIAAGLGGGSCNAASVLKLLLSLWKLNIGNDEMLKIASIVGADVPFAFQDARCCFVEGIGEIFVPLKIGVEFELVLVNPMVEINTSMSYGMFEVNNAAKKLNDVFYGGQKINKNFVKWHIYNGQNDLYDIAFQLQPKILDVINVLNQQDGCIVSRMTGSGPTCFGIFHDVKLAKAAAYKIQNSYRWFVHYEHVEL